MKRAQAKGILDKILIDFIEEINIINYNIFLSHSNFKKYHIQYLSTVSNKGKAVLDLPISGAYIYIINPFDNHKSVGFGGVRSSGKEYGEKLIDNLNNQNRLQIVLGYEAFERYYINLYAALGYLDKNLWNCVDFGNIKIKDLANKKLDWYKNKVRDIKTGNKIPIRKILNSIRNSFKSFTDTERKGDTYLCMWIEYIKKLRHSIVHNQSILPINIRNDVLSDSGYSKNGKTALILKGMMERYLEYNNNHFEILAIKSRDIKPPYHNVCDPTKTIIDKLCMHVYISYTLAMKYFGQTGVI